MAGLEDCLGAARAALDGFELQALPLAAIAGAMLLALLIRALLAQRVPSITVEPVTGAAQGPPPAPCCRALCAQQCDARQGGSCTVAAVWGLERWRRPSPIGWRHAGAATFSQHAAPCCPSPAIIRRGCASQPRAAQHPQGGGRGRRCHHHPLLRPRHSRAAGLCAGHER